MDEPDFDNMGRDVGSVLSRHGAFLHHVPYLYTTMMQFRLPWNPSMTVQWLGACDAPAGATGPSLDQLLLYGTQSSIDPSADRVGG